MIHRHRQHRIRPARGKVLESSVSEKTIADAEQFRPPQWPRLVRIGCPDRPPQVPLVKAPPRSEEARQLVIRNLITDPHTQSRSRAARRAIHPPAPRAVLDCMGILRVGIHRIDAMADARPPVRQPEQRIRRQHRDEVLSLKRQEHHPTPTLVVDAVRADVDLIERSEKGHRRGGQELELRQDEGNKSDPARPVEHVRAHARRKQRRQARGIRPPVQKERPRPALRDDRPTRQRRGIVREGHAPILQPRRVPRTAR